jgi:signal transduction histidine kinase
VASSLRHRLVRIAAAGVACVLFVAAGGAVLERALLGATQDAARMRAETEVRAAFDAMARRLRGMTGALVDGAALRNAARDDTSAARRLFVAAEQAIGGDEPIGAAVTVYDAEGEPIAWAGPTSELPPERLLGGEAWFLGRGPLGLRLVYARPVDAAGSRLGIVTAERPLGPRAGIGEDPAAFRIPTRFGDIAIDPATAGAAPGASAFVVAAPSGDPLLTARIGREDLENTRERWRRATWSFAMMALGVTLVLLIAPVLDWRNRARAPAAYAAAVIAAATLMVAARLVLRMASPADWSNASIFSAVDYASQRLQPLLVSPFDFLATCLMAGGVTSLFLFAVEAWRTHARAGRRSPDTPSRFIGYVATQLAAGVAVAAILLTHQALVRDTIANTSLDLLHFALRPLDPARLALQIGLVVAHATAVGLAAIALRAAQAPWRVARGHWKAWLATAACWSLPLVAWHVLRATPLERELPLLAAMAAVLVLGLGATRLKARYRHGSQGFRLTLLTLALIVPAFALYPATVQLAVDAKEQLVATLFAPEALHQDRTLQAQLEASLRQIDRFPGLGEALRAPRSAGEITTDQAFRIWQSTPLSAPAPVTSSVELYGPDDRLVSRFAFNLPEDPSVPPGSDEQTCAWTVYGEVAPFFADERRVLHAGRRVCEPGTGRHLGSIVVHAMLDYENLPFISSRSPYVELLRPADPLRDEGLPGRDVEYAFYGWSRRPIYTSSDTAWLLPDDVFARVEAAREPFWARLRRGTDEYSVYLQNNRAGIYALGFPVTSALGHLVNLAELTVLAVGTYILLLGANALFRFGRRTSAPALLREVRASFYRKLFLAFVAAVILPVVALALVTRNFVAGEIRRNIEQEAVRTAGAATKVVEDLVGPRAAQQGANLDDNLTVWVSRLIDQDVNIFDGPRLVATSERNLFASGVLPTRTPAEAYHALRLRNEAAVVVRERIAQDEYLVAGMPLNLRQLEGILTVPLASRQQEIDQEIATLDRRVLLAALLFILAGAGLGYSMAERIADPVSRLTRATRRIARGDFDARIAARSSDELRRLVEDFNSMAADLQRQRGELERTHRLEAWAEMARQVAHEIKNPLTPIQLNAEHLRRVHADRGEPLSPVLQDCVSNILTQVKLLRRIASEFSSFASSPTARPGPVDVHDLVGEIVEPYRAALADRIEFRVDVPASLPLVLVDRTLVARSLTNVIENALHAMPGQGRLAIAADGNEARVRIRISDTGAGMDPEALARAFEPYFSTKASGTGLGLPIAKRNVELSGGSVHVESERDRGTTVEMVLPVAPRRHLSPAGADV